MLNFPLNGLKINAIFLNELTTYQSTMPSEWGKQNLHMNINMAFTTISSFALVETKLQENSKI